MKYVLRWPIIRELEKENYNLYIVIYKLFRKIKRNSSDLFMMAPIIRHHVRNLLEERMMQVKKSSSIWNAEADFILQNGPCRFPYRRLQSIEKVEAEYDDYFNMPYVLHKSKKLFFPRGFGLKQCERIYRSLVETDCILGGNYLEKQPHQYLSDSFKIEKGDVLADVGCAEALLALDKIDNLDKVFLFESDKRWIPALNATFMDYKSKVIIINKLVSGSDSTTTISLRTALRDVSEKRVFIKMDIEGAELDVLSGSKRFLSESKNIRLAVCTYHRQTDGNRISSLFDEMGYKHEFSDGWMYIKGADKEIQFPFFRHGVIRGWK